MRFPLTSSFLTVVLTLHATAAAQSRGEPDPVIWEFQLEGVEMRIRHAEAELERVSGELEWVKRLSGGEEVGQLAIIRPFRGGHDEYRPVALEVERCRRAVVEADAELRLRKLDLQEMEITGGLPNTSLWASLVRSRDFVTERMHVQLGSLNDAIGVTKARHDACKILLDQRAMPWRELAELESELEEASGIAERLKLQLEMRQLFLNNALPLDANYVLEEQELDRRQSLLALRIAHARSHVAEIEPLAISGYAGQIDEDQARHELRRLTRQWEHLDLDRRMFEYRLAKWRAAQMK